MKRLIKLEGEGEREGTEGGEKGREGEKVGERGRKWERGRERGREGKCILSALYQRSSLMEVHVSIVVDRCESLSTCFERNRFISDSFQSAKRKHIHIFLSSNSPTFKLETL
jgi:hypothetical protein